MSFRVSRCKCHRPRCQRTIKHKIISKEAFSPQEHQGWSRRSSPEKTRPISLATPRLDRKGEDRTVITHTCRQKASRSSIRTILSSLHRTQRTLFGGKSKMIQDSKCFKKPKPCQWSHPVSSTMTPSTHATTRWRLRCPSQATVGLSSRACPKHRKAWAGFNKNSRSQAKRSVTRTQA